jgi:hypothetical protein
VSHRLIPFVILISVTGLLVPYGSTSWAWLAGPVAATAIWLLERRSHAPAEPAPARRAVVDQAAAAEVEAAYAAR